MEKEARNIEAAWEKTASWEDVRAKGDAILANGGVEIYRDDSQEIGAYVMSGVVDGMFPVSDGGPYEVILSKRSWENKNNVGGWVQSFICGCAWGTYHSGRPGQGWHGRFCSHAWATLQAANARAKSDFMGDRTASLQYNPDNFYESTKATWAPCNTPEVEPDFVSDSGSMYWHYPEGVVRGADHWGIHIGDCDWRMFGDRNHVSSWFDTGELRYGFCPWQAFEVNDGLSEGEWYEESVDGDSYVVECWKKIGDTLAVVHVDYDLDDGDRLFKIIVDGEVAYEARCSDEDEAMTIIDEIMDGTEIVMANGWQDNGGVYLKDYGDGYLGAVSGVRWSDLEPGGSYVLSDKFDRTVAQDDAVSVEEAMELCDAAHDVAGNIDVPNWSEDEWAFWASKTAGWNGRVVEVDNRWVGEYVPAKGSSYSSGGEPPEYPEFDGGATVELSKDGVVQYRVYFFDPDDFDPDSQDYQIEGIMQGYADELCGAFKDFDENPENWPGGGYEDVIKEVLGDSDYDWDKVAKMAQVYNYDIIDQAVERILDIKANQFASWQSLYDIQEDEDVLNLFNQFRDMTQDDYDEACRRAWEEISIGASKTALHGNYDQYADKLLDLTPERVEQAEFVDAYDAQIAEGWDSDEVSVGSGEIFEAEIGNWSLWVEKTLGGYYKWSVVYWTDDVDGGSANSESDAMTLAVGSLYRAVSEAHSVSASKMASHVVTFTTQGGSQVAEWDYQAVPETWGEFTDANLFMDSYEFADGEAEEIGLCDETGEVDPWALLEWVNGMVDSGKFGAKVEKDAWLTEGVWEDEGDCRFKFINPGDISCTVYEIDPFEKRYEWAVMQGSTGHVYAEGVCGSFEDGMAMCDMEAQKQLDNLPLGLDEDDIDHIYVMVNGSKTAGFWATNNNEGYLHSFISYGDGCEGEAYESGDWFFYVDGKIVESGIENSLEEARAACDVEHEMSTFAGRKTAELYELEDLFDLSRSLQGETRVDGDGMWTWEITEGGDWCADNEAAGVGPYDSEGEALDSMLDYGDVRLAGRKVAQEVELPAIIDVWNLFDKYGVPDDAWVSVGDKVLLEQKWFDVIYENAANKQYIENLIGYVPMSGGSPSGLISSKSAANGEWHYDESLDWWENQFDPYFSGDVFSDGEWCVWDMYGEEAASGRNDDVEQAKAECQDAYEHVKGASRKTAQEWDIDVYNTLDGWDGWAEVFENADGVWGWEVSRYDDGSKTTGTYVDSNFAFNTPDEAFDDLWGQDRYIEAGRKVAQVTSDDNFAVGDTFEYWGNVVEVVDVDGNQMLVDLVDGSDPDYPFWADSAEMAEVVGLAASRKVASVPRPFTATDFVEDEWEFQFRGSDDNDRYYLKSDSDYVLDVWDDEFVIKGPGLCSGRGDTFAEAAQGLFDDIGFYGTDLAIDFDNDDWSDVREWCRRKTAMPQPGDVVFNDDVSAVEKGIGRSMENCHLFVECWEPDGSYQDMFGVGSDDVMFMATVTGETLEGGWKEGRGIATTIETAVAMACGEALVEITDSPSWVIADKTASVKKATRMFTYAEQKELEDEIEGTELHNADRFKDGGVAYYGAI